jgi:uncharacterized membrane protein
MGGMMDQMMRTSDGAAGWVSTTVVLVVLLLGAVVALIMLAARTRGHPVGPEALPRRSSRDQLDRRLAEGDIDDVTYVYLRGLIEEPER